jgi:hypothetical protein
VDRKEIDESDRSQIRRLLFWPNQQEDVLLATKGQPHDATKCG